MATRGSYVHIYGKIFGGILKMLVLCNVISKYWWFQKKGFTRLLELLQLYKQNPFEKIFIPLCYQNYTLASTK